MIQRLSSEKITVNSTCTNLGSYALSKNFNKYCKSISVYTFVFDLLQTFLYQFCFVTLSRSFFFLPFCHIFAHSLKKCTCNFTSYLFFRFLNSPSISQFTGFFAMIRRQFNPFAERRCHDEVR